MKAIAVALCLFLILTVSTATSSAVIVHVSADTGYVRANCSTKPTLCPQPFTPIPNVFGQTQTGGRDEAAVAFYSTQPGSGNSSIYYLKLPNEPPTKPNQAGTAGTWNFELHRDFWFGMALCDTQSAPENVTTCTPNSDSNTYDNPNSLASDFIGLHHGTAYMELQFYPPGWAPFQMEGGISCDKVKWCAALTIFSYDWDLANNVPNNFACATGPATLEPENFAFITLNGLPQGPPDPKFSNAATFTPNPARDLLMSPDDLIRVDIHDTPFGVQAVLTDLTSGQAGLMTASALLGFSQVLYEPFSPTCDEVLYSFHPMYATSSIHTRVPWAVQSYNIAYSDEIGGFEFCNSVDSFGHCTSGSPQDPNSPDSDDVPCVSASGSLLIAVSGCSGTDSDFDGPTYGFGGNWPGTNSSVAIDRMIHPEPVMFTSPLFFSSASLFLPQPYDTAAFESDLPFVEGCSTNATACANPPVGDRGPGFYPIFSTTNNTAFGGGCNWQFGGPYLPSTNTFDGNSASEYGTLLPLSYPSPMNGTFGDYRSTNITRYNDYRQIIGYNPCVGGTSGTKTIAIQIGTHIGWNLISLPIVPVTTSLTTLLAPLLAKGEVKMVWAYTGTPRSWKFFAPGSPPTGTLTTMTDGNGYWIYVNQADTLLVNGFVIPPASSPPTYSLVQGWNLVGFKPQPTIGSETLGNYLASITGMYDTAHVYTYDNSAGIWKTLAASDSLSVGQAFYVIITAPSGTTLKP